MSRTTTLPLRSARVTVLPSRPSLTSAGIGRPIDRSLTMSEYFSRMILFSLSSSDFARSALARRSAMYSLPSSFSHGELLGVLDGLGEPGDLSWRET